MTITEIVTLDEINPNESPPCDLLCPYPRKCGTPAAARLRITCRCGNISTEFTCAGCLANINAGNYVCGVCWMWGNGVVREC